MSGFRLVYMGRHPPAKDLLGRAFAAVGSVCRAAGVALDELGCMIQGPLAVREQPAPNLAWMPFVADPAIKTPGKTLGEVALSASGQDAHKVSLVAPVKGRDVFVAPNATVLGHVSIGEHSSIWYGAILRGDLNAIVIGSKTNIQDNVIIHVARDSPDRTPRPTVIGSNVTVGHGATLHACNIGDGCLVGMAATVLDGAVLEPGSIVAAGALVTPGTVVKKGQVWAGSPAKMLRQLTAEEATFVAASADNYAKLAIDHRIENGKIFEELAVDAAIAEERAWREKTDIDVHQGIYRDPKTQTILSMR